MKKGNFETFLVRDAEYTFGFVYDDKYRDEGKRPLSFKLSKQDLKDLHHLLSELLETHTVKEECSCPKEFIKNNHCMVCGKEETKEQPTTPEKNRKDWILHDGIYFPPKNECFAHRIPNHDIKDCWDMVYKKPSKEETATPEKKCCCEKRNDVY